MRDFAPVPFRALHPGTLSSSALRLLAYLLMVWVSQGQPEEVEVSDHELLRGQRDRLSGRRLHPCGLRRNTMKKARTDLEEVGFIRCRFLREENQQRVYGYDLVKSMTLADERIPLEQAPTDDQEMTVPGSKSDALYKEKKKEKTPAREGRDGKERQSRELSASRAGLADMAFKLLRELYPQHHPDSLPLPNPQTVKSVLRNFLLENPNWSEEVVLNGIHNYYQSESTNKVTSPERWLRRIPEFSAGALNRYNRVVSNPDHYHIMHKLQSSTYGSGSWASSTTTPTRNGDDEVVPW